MNTECTVVSLTILCVTVTVRNVSDTMREMSRLTMVLPNACRTVESYDQYIRDNITVLRNKIAQARLLASYLQVNCLYSSLYCTRILTRYSRINYMDKTLQNRCYMCIQWTRVLYYVVITQQSNSPISQFNSLCNEFMIVWSMFVLYNNWQSIISDCL